MPVLYRHLDDLPERFRGGVVSIGNFDGVHWGHARIVERLLDMARRQGVRAVILTFDPHPARLLRPVQAPTPLSWTEHKARLLARTGSRCRGGLSDRSGPVGAHRRRILRAHRPGPACVPAGWSKGRTSSSATTAAATSRSSSSSAGWRAFPWKWSSRRRIDGQVVSSSRVRTLISAGAGCGGRPAAHPALPHSRDGDPWPGPRKQARLSRPPMSAASTPFCPAKGSTPAGPGSTAARTRPR